VAGVAGVAGVPGGVLTYDRICDMMCPRRSMPPWPTCSGRNHYIHTNPIKHGCVRIGDGVLVVEGKRVRIPSDHVLDVHRYLAHYLHSSYHYYLREHGDGFLTDAWMRYPIPDYLAHDDF